MVSWGDLVAHSIKPRVAFRQLTLRFCSEAGGPSSLVPGNQRTIWKTLQALKPGKGIRRETEDALCRGGFMELW